MHHNNQRRGTPSSRPQRGGRGGNRGWQGGGNFPPVSYPGVFPSASHHDQQNAPGGNQRTGGGDAGQAGGTAPPARDEEGNRQASWGRDGGWGNAPNTQNAQEDDELRRQLRRLQAENAVLRDRLAIAHSDREQDRQFHRREIERYEDRQAGYNDDLVITRAAYYLDTGHELTPSRIEEVEDLHRTRRSRRSRSPTPRRRSASPYRRPISNRRRSMTPHQGTGSVAPRRPYPPPRARPPAEDPPAWRASNSRVGDEDIEMKEQVTSGAGSAPDTSTEDTVMVVEDHQANEPPSAMVVEDHPVTVPPLAVVTEDHPTGVSDPEPPATTAFLPVPMVTVGRPSTASSSDTRKRNDRGFVVESRLANNDRISLSFVRRTQDYCNFFTPERGSPVEPYYPLRRDENPFLRKRAPPSDPYDGSEDDETEDDETPPPSKGKGKGKSTAGSNADPLLELGFRKNLLIDPKVINYRPTRELEWVMPPDEAVREAPIPTTHEEALAICNNGANTEEFLPGARAAVIRAFSTPPEERTDGQRWLLHFWDDPAYLMPDSRRHPPISHRGPQWIAEHGSGETVVKVNLKPIPIRGALGDHPYHQPPPGPGGNPPGPGSGPPGPGTGHPRPPPPGGSGGSAPHHGVPGPWGPRGNMPAGTSPSVRRREPEVSAPLSEHVSYWGLYRNNIPRSMKAGPDGSFSEADWRAHQVLNITGPSRKKSSNYEEFVELFCRLVYTDGWYEALLRLLQLDGVAELTEVIPAPQLEVLEWPSAKHFEMADVVRALARNRIGARELSSFLAYAVRRLSLIRPDLSPDHPHPEAEADRRRALGHIQGPVFPAYNRRRDQGSAVQSEPTEPSLAPATAVVSQPAPTEPSSAPAGTTVTDERALAASSSEDPSVPPPTNESEIASGLGSAHPPPRLNDGPAPMDEDS
jgi:hypothetical protein